MGFKNDNKISTLMILLLYILLLAYPVGAMPSAPAPHCKNYLLTSTQKNCMISLPQYSHTFTCAGHILCVLPTHTCVLSTRQCTNLVNTTQTIVWVVHKLLCEHNNHCVNPLKWCNHTTVCACHTIAFSVQPAMPLGWETVWHIWSSGAMHSWQLSWKVCKIGIKGRSVRYNSGNNFWSRYVVCADA